MQLPDRIVLAADHAGYPLKEMIKSHLEQQGVDIVDVQPQQVDGDDYPKIIRKGCAAALEYGAPVIVVGGSGNGEAMAANKVHGIRCALVYSEETARLARAHNNANAMSFGGRLIEPELATKCTDIFLTTDFDGGRHERRVEDLE